MIHNWVPLWPRNVLETHIVDDDINVSLLGSSRFLLKAERLDPIHAYVESWAHPLSRGLF